MREKIAFGGLVYKTVPLIFELTLNAGQVFSTASFDLDLTSHSRVSFHPMRSFRCHAARILNARGLPAETLRRRTALMPRDTRCLEHYFCGRSIVFPLPIYDRPTIICRRYEKHRILMERIPYLLREGPGKGFLLLF